MADFLTSPVAPFSPVAVDSSGLFSPGPAATLDAAIQIINKCVELAESKDADFEIKMGELTDAATGWLATHAAADVTAGAISITAPTEPPMTVGDTSPALVFANANAQSTAIIADTAAKFGTFMSTWFPDDTANFAAAEAYLLAAITNTTSGILPAGVSAAILENSRAQILAEESRAVADLYESPVAMRHRFPTGAMAGQALRLAQSSLDRIAQTSREAAIKDFELSHQTALEAVRMAMASRVAAIGTAKEYVASLVSGGYQLGQQLTGAAHQAEVAKLSAGYQAYAGRINAAELALRATQANETISLDAAKANQSRDLAEIENYVKAFLAQAQVLGHEVISMLNNVRAGSSATYSVSV